MKRKRMMSIGLSFILVLGFYGIIIADGGGEVAGPHERHPDRLRHVLDVLVDRAGALPDARVDGDEQRHVEGDAVGRDPGGVPELLPARAGPANGTGRQAASGTQPVIPRLTEH